MRGNNENDLIARARAAAKVGDRAAARAALEQAVEVEPGNAQAWYLLSQVVGDDELVVACLEKVLDIDPYNEQARARLMRWQSAMKEPDPLLEELSPPPKELGPTADEPEGGLALTTVALAAIVVLLLGLLGVFVGRDLLAPQAAIYYAEQAEYNLYLPKDYSPETRWPVFVGVHGFGGTGQDCLDLWQDYADNNGFVLLCPWLADENGGWYQDEGERVLYGVLRVIRRDYSVQRQVFLAGFSAGGQFVQGYTFANPDDVAAVVVLSAGNYYEPVADASHIPFRVIIGERDNKNSLANAQTFIDLLLADGYDVEMQIIPNAGHRVTRSARELTIEFFNQVYGFEE